MRGLHWKVIREARNFVTDHSLLVERKERHESRVEYLTTKHSICDRAVVDLQHEIEFAEDCSVEEQLEFYTELKRILELRRVIKDRIDFYKQLNLFYKRGATKKQFRTLGTKIEAMIAAKQNRQYKKRVKESEAV